MKILQLTNKIPYPPKDGGAIATLNLSKGLARIGHQVTILGMNTTKHFSDLNDIPRELTDLVTFKDVHINTDLRLGAAVKNLLFSSNPYNAERFFNEQFSKALTDLLKNEHFDVVQLEGLYMAYYIGVIRKYSKAVIALRAHNIEHEIWNRVAQQEKSAWKKMYLGIMARRIKQFKLKILNTYDLLIPITDRDARQFDRFGNKKPSLTIPAGYELSDSLLHRSSIKFPSVFFIGTLDWFPNQEGLIWFLDKVWPLVLEQQPGVQFNVAGRNAPRWLEILLKKSPNVNFLGEIDNAARFISENAVMVAPLFSGSGMRVKIIEGMAFGKSIVSTTIGAEGIDVAHGKNIMIDDHEEGFAQCINQLLNNRTFFEEMGENAVRFVRENYDNHKISLLLAEFYTTHSKK